MTDGIEDVVNALDIRAIVPYFLFAVRVPVRANSTSRSYSSWGIGPFGGIFPDVDLDTDDPEAKVSRRHARITLNNGQYFLEDLGSTNGTFINRGKRLAPGQRQALCDGDEIIVGKTFLRFHIVK